MKNKIAVIDQVREVMLKLGKGAIITKDDVAHIETGNNAFGRLAMGQELEKGKLICSGNLRYYEYTITGNPPPDKKALRKAGFEAYLKKKNAGSKELDYVMLCGKTLRDIPASAVTIHRMPW